MSLGTRKKGRYIQSLQQLLYGQCHCRCLGENVLLESLVITLTVVACVAITGQTLVSFDLITVPKIITPKTDAKGNETTSSSSSTSQLPPNASSTSMTQTMQEDEHIMDILELVFRYTSIGIAGLFLFEIGLKAAFLQKTFFRKCWQVFDGIVVLGFAGVQVAFLLISVAPEVYCVSFLVILRLWRIPFVCYMKALQETRLLEQDVELYRAGKQKAEEKCSRLEVELNRKKDEIKKLKSQKVPSTMHYGNETNSEVSRQAKLSALRGMKNISSMHNSFDDVFNDPPLKSESSLSVGDKMLSQSNGNIIMSRYPTQAALERNGQLIHRNMLGNYEHALTAGRNNLLKEKYIAMGIFSGSLPRSEALYDIKSYSANEYNPIKHENSVYWQRRRCSSAGDIMAYSNLNSPEKIIPNAEKKLELMNTNSCPALDLNYEGNEKDQAQANDDNVDDLDSPSKKHVKHEKQSSVVSEPGLSSSEMNDIGSDNSNEPIPRANKRVKRFPSCPEYVYTQRMSVTNDESLLIEETHTRFEPTGIENSAFLDDGDVPLQILAEIDGTKTYRSEAGVPMTSL